MYYHQHRVEIHLEVKNVLPRRDHGLAGAYCGRCRRPDVYVEENRHHCHYLEEKASHVSVIVIITTIQMCLYHSYMHFHVWLCFRGHHLAPWLHITIMAPLTHGHGYGIMDLPVFNV